MADYIYSDGELYHYGVLGMKWGKRKAAKQIYTKIKRNSGRDKYFTDLSNPIRDDVKTHESFKQYKKTAKNTWRKYLDESDRMDKDYERTIRKIHKDPKFKKELADLEKQILLDHEKGTRGYEKEMEYAIDALESNHSLFKQYSKREAQYSKTRDAAYDSAKALANDILGKYGGRRAANMNQYNAKARDIVESVITNEMMADYYSEKYRK